MSSPKIEPHRITRPIQLLAVWFAGLVLLVTVFLAAAGNVGQPDWLPGLFAITAVVLVPLFVGLVFLMQTKFREQMQDDPYYADWLTRQEAPFHDFKPENILPGSDGVPLGSAEASARVEDFENWRITRYEKNEGLFLVHSWRPSRTKSQVADIVIQLSQHREGPLTRRAIEKVEYHLGPKFFRAPVIKTNAQENFRIEVSAYGPMLCVARVYLRDSNKIIDLERYINFDDEAASNAS